MKDKKTILNKLKDDSLYYSEYGQQFLSNSDISVLLKDPLSLHKEVLISPALLIGRLFHVSILEAHKIKDFKVIDSTSRNTKVYKEESKGELCLLKKEVDNVELMVKKIKESNMCSDLINPNNCDYEVPQITDIMGNTWKGKADSLNYKEGLIIDLKTSADISKFRNSAFKYNYDSQAYVYRALFGLDMLFLVIDKNSHQIGMFNCSDEFYASGEEKVRRATEAYNLFYLTEDFDPQQYFVSKTL